jgi:thiol-disulfide isomerase/thioredoxin
MKLLAFKLILISEFSFISGFGQMATKPLDIGDQCPDLIFDTIINSSISTARISDFKGKLVILDFWSTNCAGCIAEFPKLETLQKKFGNKIKIFPIAEDTNAKTKVPIFWKNNKVTNKLSLPCIIQNNKIFSELFPHKGLPHEIWIDQNGIVRGITKGSAVSERTIANFLNGVPQIFEKKPNSYFVVEPGKNFWINGYDTSFVYRSILTKYIDSLRPLIWINSNTKKIKIFAANQNIIDLYKYAYGNIPKGYVNWSKERDFFNKRIIIDKVETNLVDTLPNKTKSGRRIEDKEESRFCYELDLPNSYDTTKALLYMIQDLDRFFGIRSSVEKRKMKCMSLSRILSDNKLQNRGLQSAVSVNKDKSEFTCTTCSLDVFVSYLNNQYKNIAYILNDTNYKQLVDITINLTDLDSIEKSLHQYGLELKYIDKELDMLVLKNGDLSNRP